MPLQDVFRPPGVQTPVWRGLHAIVVLGLLLRLATALWSERMHQPDEIFQYLEQAHRLVFGYGYVPWEYRYGLRNLVLPGALAAMLEATRWVGLDSPAFYVPAIRCVMAVLSLSVLYSVYFIGRALYGEMTARIAVLLAASWYELIFTSTFATPEVLGGYTALAVLALLLAPRQPSALRCVAVGVLIGLVGILRLQFLPLVGVLGAMLLLRRGWRGAVFALLGTLLPLAVLAALDFWNLGLPFASAYYNFLYNSVYKIADTFGTSPPLQYFLDLGIASTGVFAVSLLGGLADWRRSWPVLLFIAAILVPHSLIPHKEYRFVFACTAPLLLLTSRVLVAAGPLLIGRFARVERALGRGLVPVAGVLLVVSVSIMGGLYRLPAQSRIYWQSVSSREPVRLAVIDLSRRSNVVAVANTAHAWWSSGGYYYLHLPVPIYYASDLERLGLTAEQVVSHIVCDASAAPSPGFRVVARHGPIEIREREGGRPKGATGLQRDMLYLAQPSVTDRVKPLQTPRF